MSDFTSYLFLYNYKINQSKQNLNPYLNKINNNKEVLHLNILYMMVRN
jgi:hypothetical protein